MKRAQPADWAQKGAVKSPEFSIRVDFYIFPWSTKFVLLLDQNIDVGWKNKLGENVRCCNATGSFSPPNEPLSLYLRLSHSSCPCEEKCAQLVSPVVRGVLVDVWPGRGGGRAGTSADWEEQTEGGVSEGITEREGRGWRPSTWESIWLTHTHIRILLKSFTPLLHAGANWVNGYQTPVVWFILFLITRPLNFCHVVLSLRITTTPLSVVESKLLPQLYFGWPLTSLFANAAQSLTVNFYLNVKLILMIYFYSSITGGVCQSVSLNDNHLTYYTNHATFLKHLWRYISVISLDM